MNQEELFAEFKKCKEDPVYFISTYTKVIHPVRGMVPFSLYPFQIKIVNDIQKNRFNILRKFRQAGCTTIAAAYSLWIAIFQKDKNIVILSKGDIESTEILERIKLMYDELPEFLKPGIIEDNKHTLKLKTRSIIKSRSSGKQSGRSLAGSLLIIDEAAFIENIDTIWAAVYPIISTGGKVFVLSTVNGIGNWYHSVYTAASKGENSFNIIDIQWKDHPEYFYNPKFEFLYEEMLRNGLDIHKWEETTRSNMPLKQWLQEYECSFLGTGDTYFEGQLLKVLSQQTSDQYYTRYNNRMRVWEDPQPEYNYVLSCDTSLGRDRDYSAFHIINVYNGKQVAEFYSNKTNINDFARIINQEALLYNVAQVICERNTIGNNLIDWLYNFFEYENLWSDEKGDFGFQTTSKNKEIILAKLEESIRTDVLKVTSSRTIDEFMTFVVQENNKPKAEKGYHDDLIMSLALANHALLNLRNDINIDFVSKHDSEMPASISKTIKVATSKGSFTEEDYKWLMS